MKIRNPRRWVTGLIYAFVLLLTFNCTAAPQARQYEVISAGEFYAESQTLKNVISYQQDGNNLTLNLADNKIVKLQFITPSIVRVRFNKDGNYDNDYSYAIIKSDFGNVAYNIEDQMDKLVVKTTELKIEINKDPYGIAIYKDNVLLNADTKKAISWNDEGIVTHKKILPGAKFYGFGEKTGPLMKNGTNMTMWNTDAYKYNESTDPLYQSIPFFIESNDNYTYGTLFDNTYQTYFNMGRQKSDEYYFGAQDGEINYYFISGQDIKDVITKYTELTGRINMPPKWALGYQQSRYSYYPDKRVNQIAKTFRNKKLPADVIYLDIDYMDANKSFTWSKQNFPDFAGMIKGLHNQGFKVITMIDPGLKVEKGYLPFESGLKGDHFIKNANGEIAVGPVWPGDCAFPDFTRPQTRDWWGMLYKPLADTGIDGFWNDMNEPSVFIPSKTLPLDVVHYDFGQNSPHAKIHNVYGMQMIRATFDGLSKLRPDNRNFVLSRAGYAGLQRYAAVWTGDNTSNWDQLKLNIPMVLNLGLSGIPISGADIGGFTGTPSSELLVRWMQLGAFTPVYRNHTEKGTADQEPWAFGKDAEDANRKAIELRYKFIQYLYDFVYKSYKIGLPIDRPLFMEFPADKNTYGIEDEFMFGDAMLIAPVVKQDAVSREVYLPVAAEWYDYWTGQKYIGGTSYTIGAPLDSIPIFIKAGAIIPTRGVVQYIGEKPENPITFLVYPGGNYQYTLYLDDETTTNYKNGEYKEIKISNIMTENKKNIKFNVIKDGFQPKEKHSYVKLVDASEPSMIKINGEEIKPVINNNAFNSSAKGFYFDPTEKSIVIKVNDIKQDLEIEVIQ